MLVAQYCSILYSFTTTKRLLHQDQTRFDKARHLLDGKGGKHNTLTHRLCNVTLQKQNTNRNTAVYQLLRWGSRKNREYKKQTTPSKPLSRTGAHRQTPIMADRASAMRKSAMTNGKTIREPQAYQGWFAFVTVSPVKSRVLGGSKWWSPLSNRVAHPIGNHHHVTEIPTTQAHYTHIHTHLIKSSKNWDGTEKVRFVHLLTAQIRWWNQ